MPALWFFQSSDPVAWSITGAAANDTSISLTSASSSSREAASLVKTVRARACDALRHACESMSERSRPADGEWVPPPPSSSSPSSSRTSRTSRTSRKKSSRPSAASVIGTQAAREGGGGGAGGDGAISDVDGDGGGSVGGDDGSENDGSSTGAVAGFTSVADSSTSVDVSEAVVVVGRSPEGVDVDGIAELVPLVLGLAETVEGARCLRAMVAAGGSGGVGDAARVAILWQNVEVGTEGTAVGIRVVVRMLVSRS